MGKIGCLGLWFPNLVYGQVLLAHAKAFIGPGQNKKDNERKLFKVLAVCVGHCPLNALHTNSSL